MRIIIGRRWFNTREGNSYHTVEVVVDGHLVWQSPVTYGYGNQYEETARKWLARKGLVPDSRTPLHRLPGLSFESMVIDVGRKRDL
jgi:hypothetical protein